MRYNLPKAVEFEYVKVSRLAAGGRSFTALIVHEKYAGIAPPSLNPLEMMMDGEVVNFRQPESRHKAQIHFLHSVPAFILLKA